MMLRILALIATALLAAVPGADAPELLKLTGDISGVHDPVIIREGEWYYVFATGGSILRSWDPDFPD